jgi:hypothetical protein
MSALQRQHKALQGKSAQQARELRAANETAAAACAQQQVLQSDLAELGKQLQGKAAALSRCVALFACQSVSCMLPCRLASCSHCAVTHQGPTLC